MSNSKHRDTFGRSPAESYVFEISSRTSSGTDVSISISRNIGAPIDGWSMDKVSEYPSLFCLEVKIGNQVEAVSLGNEDMRAFVAGYLYIYNQYMTEAGG